MESDLIKMLECDHIVLVKDNKLKDQLDELTEDTPRVLFRQTGPLSLVEIRFECALIGGLFLPSALSLWHQSGFHAQKESIIGVGVGAF